MFQKLETVVSLSLCCITCYLFVSVWKLEGQLLIGFLKGKYCSCGCSNVKKFMASFFQNVLYAVRYFQWMTSLDCRQASWTPRATLWRHDNCNPCRMWLGIFLIAFLVNNLFDWQHMLHQHYWCLHSYVSYPWCVMHFRNTLPPSIFH